MPFKPIETEKCPKCSKPVYAAEAMSGAAHKWHKQCFACGVCKKSLDSHTVAEHEGEVYCKSCHGKKFGPKGYGFGGGAAGLSTDTGKK